MYLHIGKEIILKKEELIGIFNVESISETKEYESIKEKLKSENRLIDISNKEQKTLVLYKKKEELYGVISDISSISLGKRNNKND